MVTTIKHLFAFLLLASLPLAAAEVEVSALAEEGKVQQGNTLSVILSIKHPEVQKVDDASFRLGKSPLSGEFIKSTPLTGGRVHDFYRIEVPAVGGGLKILPPIAVKVGGKEYQSASLTYEVADGTSAELRIEAFTTKSRLYPGQTAGFGYRYIYNRPIELKEEYLPLFEPDGFSKVGSIKVSEQQRGDSRITIMEQEVKAVESGSYSFGPSHIEGIPYTVSAGGRRVYGSTPLRAEAPSIDVEVEMYPEKGKPPSFNGAIGSDLSFKMQLLSYPEMNVGDKMTVSLTIAGSGDLADVPIPELCCQPGFPGNFKLGDIPPAATMYENSKVFVVELKPLSASLRAIPPVYFSYYNPKNGIYTTLKTDPIKIKVLTPQKGLVPATESIGRQTEGLESWPGDESGRMADSYSLDASDLFNRYFGDWFVFFVIPFGVGVVIITYLRRRSPKSARQEESLKQEEAPLPLVEAFEAQGDPTRFYRLLNEAFLVRLYEKGLIPTAHIAPQQLPEKGIVGEVRSFLCSIEEKRFTGSGKIDFKELREQVQSLYDKIGASR